MSNYPTKRLCDAGVTLYDCEHKTPKPALSGYPYIAIPNIQDGRLDLSDVRLITKEDFEYWTRKIKPQAGDVIVTRRGRVGDTAEVPEGLECAIGQNLVILRSEGSEIDQTFLRWMLRGDIYEEQVNKYLNVGAIFYSLNCADIPNFELPIPPLPEQRAIAGILGALDNKIEVNSRMNTTIEAMARSVFRQWFVVNEEALGWDISPLSKLCESIFSGGTPSTTKPQYWSGGIPWLSSGETRERFVIDTDKTITQVGVDNSSTRFARSGSTVIASAGQGKTRGQTSLLMFDTFINQSVVVLNANKKLISDLFLFFDLSGRYEEFRQMSDSHSSRGSLTTKLLGDLRIAVPPIALIDKFNQFAEPIVEQIHRNLKQSRTLARLRDSLLPKLMRGEVRVKDVNN